ncbi:MAG TPA: LamG-like jellyroll fold domain-containing protein, partial [Planctomicrobium sp.]|nr:LamG-like jellyroll fold domain-containing protein [Planctomicrobium sp.]
NRGVLSARVGPTGKGFSVHTPTANVIDHGTEFAVEVFNDTSSEVHVFDGEVDVRPKMAPMTTTAVRLVTDQATRISSVGRIPQGIDISRERFIRKLTESSDGQLSSQHSYSEMIQSLQPVTYLQMASSVDGRTLSDSGTGNTPAFLHCDQMISPPFAPGRVEQALRLDGPLTTSYAIIPEFPRAMNNKITLCAWVKAESRPRWAAIAKHWAIELDETTGEPYGLGGQFHFGINEDSGELEVQILDALGKRIQIRDSEPLPLHQWNHVAFVVDGESVTLFRNGKSVDQQPCAGLGTTGPEALGIGAKLLPDGSAPDERNPGFWDGRIDELAIFHHALSPDQIKSLFESGQ